MSEGSGPGRSPSATLAALAEARRTGLELADELLTHLPDLGDAVTQRAVDAWVEQAADSLRALAEACEERLLDLGRPPAHAEDHADNRADDPTRRVVP